MQGLRWGNGDRSIGPGHARLRRAGLPQRSRRGALFPRRASRRNHGADPRCSLRLYRQSRLRVATFLREPDTMPDTNTLLLGAVAYDPKVVTIWDGFQVYFQKCGLPFDYI